MGTSPFSPVGEKVAEGRMRGHPVRNTPHPNPPNPLPLKGRGNIAIGDRDLPKNHNLYVRLIQAIEHGEPEKVERQFGAARLENLWMA